MLPADAAAAFQKARHDLGWDPLLDHLAARCHTSRGAAAARQLEPGLDGDAIRARLAEVTEAKALHDTAEPMGFGGAVEIEPHLERAEKGGHLEGAALREVGATVAAAARLKRHLMARGPRVPRLLGRAALIAELPDVTAAIDDSFDDAGRLRDDASPALGGLRRKAANLHEELARRARSLLDHPSVAPHLQDHFYTQREERYVVPVRADARSRVKGIVHGTSGSGATVFVEPEELVDLNNRLKLAELEVSDEERRIYGELTLLVRDALGPIRIDLEVLSALDLIDGAARLSIDLGGREPALATDEPARIDLRNARHPLMLLSGQACVPNDVLLDVGATMIISGPNAGGKTVALKIVGLLSLMARAGLHVPAQEGSRLPLFEPVLTDVGDDQSLERNLSTFSAHVHHLRRFLLAAGRSALVLLDEVAVGTDPEQGAALAQAVLEALAARGATVVVTTHYDRLKALAARDRRFVNASVGFDLERLEPTYKLHLGVPGASGAIVVARRLGLPADVAARATELAGDETTGLEALLRQVEGERVKMVEERARLASEQAAAEVARRRAEELEALARERAREARKAAHDDAVAALQKARVELEQQRSQLRRGAASSKDTLVEARRAVDAVAKRVQEHAPAPAPAEGAPLEPAGITVGMEVMVPRLGGRGVVISAPKDGRVGVQVGALKITALASELLAPLKGGGPRGAKPRFPRSSDDFSRAAESMARGDATAKSALRTSRNTCDLRGERVDAAVGIAEKFIDDALRSGDEVVFFVHGHGTGALRTALRERLGDSPAVAEVRGGTVAEGGDGVTAVVLA